MALRDQPYFPLYVQDYLTDEKLNMCSASSQGVYIKLLCIFHKSDSYGGILLKQKDKQKSSVTLNFAFKLAKLLPFDLQVISSALNELIDEKVLIIEDDFLYQKRMIKDNELSIERAKNGKKGGKTTQKKHKEFAKAKPKANSENEDESKNEDDIVKEIVYPFDSEKFHLYWKMWKQYKRKEHKFNYKSKISEQAALKKLGNLAQGIESNCYEILENSIANGYKGFFKAEENKKSNLIPDDYKQQILNELNDVTG